MQRVPGKPARRAIQRAFISALRALPAGQPSYKARFAAFRALGLTPEDLWAPDDWLLAGIFGGPADMAARTALQARLDRIWSGRYIARMAAECDRRWEAIAQFRSPLAYAMACGMADVVDGRGPDRLTRAWVDPASAGADAPGTIQ